jgi:hypothetical protein
MTVIELQLDGRGCWPDLTELEESGRLIDVMLSTSRLGLALVPGGMSSGAASVTIRVDLPDGRTVLTQTSLALLATSVRAMEARAANGRGLDS